MLVIIKKVLMSRLVKICKIHKRKESQYIHRPVSLAMRKDEMAGRLRIHRHHELQSRLKSTQAN